MIEIKGFKSNNPSARNTMICVYEKDGQRFVRIRRVNYKVVSEVVTDHGNSTNTLTMTLQNGTIVEIGRNMRTNVAIYKYINDVNYR
jgi:hypothetical protein